MLSNIKHTIRHHPVRSYFLITFFISWLGAFIFVTPELFSNKSIPKSDGLLLFPILLLGPLKTGLLLTYTTAGKLGMKELSFRMRKWEIPIKWYMIALFLCPLLIYMVLFFLSHFVSSAYTPNFFVLGVAFGLPAGFIEEIGWTGFAFPQMLKKNKPLRSSLLLGLLWGLWHCHEPDLEEAESGAKAINLAMNEILKIVDERGAYVAESDFFEKDWQHSFWGSNYAKLMEVKNKYDPGGLYFMYHGVGSEDWSNDGFTRLK